VEVPQLDPDFHHQARTERSLMTDETKVTLEVFSDYV